MISSLITRLVGGAPKTAADFKALLAELDLDKLQAAVEAAEVRRRDLLLSTDDKALDAAETALASARRDLDRATAARDEINRRLHQAEIDEARAVLDAARADAETEAAAVAKLLRTRWPKLTAEIVTLLKRLDAAEDAVAAVNQRLAAAGRHDDVLSPVETRAIPTPAGQLVQLHSVRSRTMLRTIPGTDGWGDSPEIVGTDRWVFGDGTVVDGSGREISNQPA